MSKFQPRKGDAVRLIIAGTMDEEWDYVPEYILVRDYDGRLHIVKKNIAHLVPARISQRDADIADAIDADDAEDNGGWYERGERPLSGKFTNIVIYGPASPTEPNNGEEG